MHMQHIHVHVITFLKLPHPLNFDAQISSTLECGANKFYIGVPYYSTKLHYSRDQKRASIINLDQIKMYCNMLPNAHNSILQHLQL